MKTRAHYLLFLGMTLLPGAASADTAATPPAGYYQLTVRGATDSLVSIPLVPRPALLARVTAVSAQGLTLAAPAAPTDGAYASASGPAYYVQFMTGNLAGLCYPVTANAGGVFTLDTQGDDLTHHALGAVMAGAASGDLVHVRPCWTVGAVFGATVDTLTLAPVPSLASAVYTAGDLVLLPDNTLASLDKSPAGRIGYIAGTGWRRQGDAVTDAAGQPLPPGVPFIVRHQAPAPVGVWVVGYLPQDRGVVRLPAVSAGGEMDVSVAVLHPVARSVAALHLAASLVPADSVLNYGDGLLDFFSGRGGFSTPPEHRLYLTTSGWFEGDTASDAYPLSPGLGYVLRLRGAHPVGYWLQSLPYAP